MFSLAYVSDETTSFDDAALVALARSAAPVNRAAAITGYLSWKQGRFFQYLEGPEDDVRALMTRIAHDCRHDVVRVLELSSFDERRFDEWNMRLVRASDYAHIRMQDVLESVLRSMRDPLFDEPHTRSIVTRLVAAVADQPRETHTRLTVQTDAEGRVVAGEPDIVVGIGASAGGLRPLQEIFRTLPNSINASFVVVQHFPSNAETIMDSILRRETAMPVTTAANDMPLLGGHVYVVPPGNNLEVSHGVFQLSERDPGTRGRQHAVDILFASLASEYGSRAVAVVLSGTGADGADGIRQISAADGIVLAQSGDSSEFSGMPLAAIHTGTVRHVLGPGAIAEFIERLVLGGRNAAAVMDPARRTHYVRTVVSLIDEEDCFSRYKEDTLFRRIEQRRLAAGIVDRDAYIAFCNDHPDELVALGNDLLITVTSFFRDPQAWSRLQTEIVPAILDDLTDGEPLHAWVSGCASGEEAYTLAIVLTEAFETLDRPVDFYVYATDIEHGALHEASRGRYAESAMQDLSEARVQRYFVADEDAYEVDQELRAHVIFESHNLVADAPYTHMHLVTCRNVLIYMQPDLQQQVLRALHFSLHRNGILMLGRSETLGRMQSEFHTVDGAWNLHRKRRASRLPLHHGPNTPPGARPRQRLQRSGTRSQARESGNDPELTNESLSLLAEASGTSAVLIDVDLQALYIVADPHRLFGVRSGQPSRDVRDMLPSAIAKALTVAARSAFGEGVTVRHSGLWCYPERQDPQTIDLEVHPQRTETPGRTRRALVLFRASKIRGEDANLHDSDSERGRIDNLTAELEQTRNSLQVAVDELESSFDVERSTNEQLITSNEELQSSNEELQSVNQELYTVNFEYQSKINELADLNNDLDNLLSSHRLGVIFLDSALRIRRVSKLAARHTNLLPSDVGRPFTDLSHGLPIDDLAMELNRVMSTGEAGSFRVSSQKSAARLRVGIDPYRTDHDLTQGVLITLQGETESDSEERVTEEPVIGDS